MWYACSKFIVESTGENVVKIFRKDVDKVQWLSFFGPPCKRRCDDAVSDNVDALQTYSGVGDSGNRTLPG